MTDWTFHTNLIVQAWAFLVAAFVSLVFGGAILAQQIRAGVRPTWPMPGGLVGGTYFTAIGVQFLHMSLGRLRLLPWSFISTEATLIYCLIAGIAVSTLVRWWRHGFDDAEPIG